MVFIPRGNVEARDTHGHDRRDWIPCPIGITGKSEVCAL
jgi:hypothetical protein